MVIASFGEEILPRPRRNSKITQLCERGAESRQVPLDIATPNGRAVEINQVVIQKGLDNQLVLYWYQDRGRIVTSEYWAKIYLVLDAMTKQRTDGALVRVTMPFADHDEGDVQAWGKAFAEKILPLLEEYLPS
jgi:EpsI family protein